MWSGCWLLVEALGVGLGAPVLGVGQLVVHGCLGAVLGLAGVVMWHSGDRQRTPLASAVRGLLWGAGSMVTFSVASTGLPWLGVFGVLLALATAPPVVGRLG